MSGRLQKLTARTNGIRNNGKNNKIFRKNACISEKSRNFVTANQWMEDKRVPQDIRRKRQAQVAEW